MADNLITRMRRRLNNRDIKSNTKESRQWFLVNARKLGSRARTSQVARGLSGDRANTLTRRPKIGRMYMFFYDPKGKKDLPYYDRFPLIFPVKYYDNGFLGINLHYLPPKLRLVLFESLLKISNNKKYDETTKLKMSYAALQTISRNNLVKPTVKRYLNSQLRSIFTEVPAEDWEIAVFLPLERFEKASNRKVWADSRRKI